MQDLINTLTARLGIDAGAAQSGVGSLLRLIKKEGDGGAVSDLFDKLPGANAMEAEHGGNEGGGGLLGSVTGALGNLGGGTASALAGITASIGPDKLKEFAQIFVGYAKKFAGEDTVNKVIGSVPALKSLL